MEASKRPHRAVTNERIIPIECPSRRGTDSRASRSERTDEYRPSRNMDQKSVELSEL